MFSLYFASRPLGIVSRLHVYPVKKKCLPCKRDEITDAFISLQSHIQVLESTQENITALLMGLEYLINICYVDDTEVFKVKLFSFSCSPSSFSMCMCGCTHVLVL